MMDTRAAWIPPRLLTVEEVAGPRRMTPAAIRKWGAEVDRACKGDLHQERGFTQQTILGLGRFLAPAKAESAADDRSFKA